MIWFELQPLDRLPNEQIILAWAEIFALVKGSFQINDLLLDKETVIASAPNDERFAEVADMVDEPAAAFLRLLELIEVGLITSAECAEEDYPFRYPFEICPDEGSILKLREDLSQNIAGASYLAMQFQQLIRHELVYVWTDNPKAKSKRAEHVFHKDFDRLFEMVATIAIAAEHQGYPFAIGACRSVRLALLPAINSMGEVAAGVQAKLYTQLNKAQKAANDGGTDGVVIKLGDNPPPISYLIGATRQLKGTRDKVVGVDQMRRFQGYLIDHTRLGQYLGAFAHAEPANDGATEHCFERGCLYYPREQILKKLDIPQPNDRLRRRLFLTAQKQIAFHLSRIAKLEVKI